MSKKIIKIIGVFGIVLVAILLGLMITTEKLVELKCEVGNPIPEKVQLKYAEVKVKWDNSNNHKIGTYYGTSSFLLKQVKVKLTIYDDESPVISGVKDLTYDGSQKLDLTSHITVSDNSKEQLELQVHGEYKLSKDGKYNLKYYVKDGSGNETEETFVLTVRIKSNSALSIKNNYTVTTEKGYKIDIKDSIAYIGDDIIVNKTYSVPKNFVPSNLVSISSKCQVVANVVDPFEELVNDSSLLGLNIYPATCYRSYSFQNILYTNYVKRDGVAKADTYSARPGHSEHHTGLAIDLNTVNDAFSKTEEAKWVNDNCYKYGFIIRYPKGKEQITGYQYEPWHLRYVGEELAIELYNDGDWLTMEEYFGFTSEYK